MKIFYIAYKDDYNTRTWEKTNRTSPLYYTTYQPLVKLAKKSGHTIRPFWVDEVLIEKGEKGMNEDLREAFFAEKPDVALFESGIEDNFDKKVLAEIKEKSPALTVLIAGDDSWNFDGESKHYAHYFSWIATCHSAAVKRYLALGCKQVTTWQGGANLDVLKPTNEAKDIDVSFVGTWSKPRGKVIHALRKAGIDVTVRGNGWPGGGVSNEEMISIFSRSKISLCLNPPAFTVNARSFFRLFFRRARLGEGGARIKLDIQNFPDNVRTWWQKRTPNIKGRHFEIPALRTMQMSEDADNLAAHYVPGKEIIIYTDTNDLIEKTKYYLAHPEEREAIARAGYERTIKDHARDKRIYDLFSAIGRPL